MPKKGRVVGGRITNFTGTLRRRSEGSPALGFVPLFRFPLPMPANTKRPHQLPIGSFACGLIGRARVLGGFSGTCVKAHSSEQLPGWLLSPVPRFFFREAAGGGKTTPSLPRTRERASTPKSFPVRLFHYESTCARNVTQ